MLEGDIVHQSPATEDDKAAARQRQRADDIFRALQVVFAGLDKQVLERDVLRSPGWKGRGEEDVEDSIRMAPFFRHFRRFGATDIENVESAAVVGNSAGRGISRVARGARGGRFGVVFLRGVGGGLSVRSFLSEFLYLRFTREGASCSIWKKKKMI